MAPIGPLRHRLRRLARSERGMALPTALFAMIASFALASAAVIASVDAQRGTARDHDSKEAIAAADAGASVAMLRLNRYASALSPTQPCLGMSGETLTLTSADPAAPGWCSAISGSVGGATYSYRVEASSGTTTSVVAVGTANGVSRRIDVSFGTSTVPGILQKAGVIAAGDITIDNNADIKVGIGTNGNVNLENNSSVCGDIRHGVGKKLEMENNASQCGGYEVTEGNETLPPVSSFMPEDIATNNSDYRLVKCTVLTKTERQPPGCQEDSYETSNHKGFGTTVPWNASTRTISTGENSTLTLSGGDYFICRLVLSNNSHLIMAASAHVRIFFDTPENCGLGSGAEQISVSNNSDIQSTGYQESEQGADLIGLYLTGSTSISTKIVWANNGGTTNEFVLYAPNTDIVIENNATYKGVLVGKTVTLTNNATVEQDAGFEPPQIGGATLYARQSYVECTGATYSTPSENC